MTLEELHELTMFAPVRLLADVPTFECVVPAGTVGMLCHDYGGDTYGVQCYDPVPCCVTVRASDLRPVPRYRPPPRIRRLHLHPEQAVFPGRTLIWLYPKRWEPLHRIVARKSRPLPSWSWFERRHK